MGKVVCNLADIDGIDIAVGMVCIDARFLGNEQFAAELKKKTGIDKIYTPRIAGPDKRLAEGHPACVEIAKFEAAEAHELTGTKLFLLIGHGGCARHPVSDEQHRADTWKAAERLAAELKDGWQVMPLFTPIVGQTEGGDDLWGVEIVTPETAAAEAA